MALHVMVAVTQEMSSIVVSTNGTGVAISIGSQVGVTYALQYVTGLTNQPLIWLQADEEPGTGGPIQLQDATPADPQRYYRAVIP